MDEFLDLKKLKYPLFIFDTEHKLNEPIFCENEEEFIRSVEDTMNDGGNVGIWEQTFAISSVEKKFRIK